MHLENLILGLQSQISDLNKSVLLLRKQVARVELKSVNLGSVNAAVQPEELLDFESMLAGEGLPLKTCVETNDFENKLRNDTDFRKKIVSRFI